MLRCEGGADGAEACNGLDDDCDGLVDEDEGLLDNPRNCGACGNVCELSSAEAGCEEGMCTVERCLAGFSDADGVPANGCEHMCVETESCNEIDDDCDGEIDEGTSGEECDTGLSGRCGQGEKLCFQGKAVCESTFTPTSEVCANAIDEDCDAEIDENCTPPECSEILFGIRRYFFCGERRTWLDARDGCLALQASFATISDETENFFVAVNAGALVTGTAWWIGFNDRDMEGTWVWDDSAPITFTAWFTKEPNNGPPGTPEPPGEDCGSVPEHTPLTWNDASCDALKPFICETSAFLD